jgi:hypothetical protein
MSHLCGGRKECFKGYGAAVGDDPVANPMEVEETAVSYEVLGVTQGMSARAA